MVSDPRLELERLCAERGADFAGRPDSSSAFRRGVIFGGGCLRTVFSRAAIHESILALCRGRAICSAFR